STGADSVFSSCPQAIARRRAGIGRSARHLIINEWRQAQAPDVLLATPSRRHRKAAVHCLLPDVAENALGDCGFLIVGERRRWKLGKNPVQDRCFHLALGLLLFPEPIELGELRLY